MISAFILLHQMKDWAGRGGIIAQDEGDYWEHCPFAQIVMEIATGAKHQIVSKATVVRDPSVLRFRGVSDYGMGAYGVGHYSGANFQVEGRRFKADVPGWHGVAEVLSEPRDWWAEKLKAL